MLKILPIASAFLAATTLWGQLEPVGITVGQTVRLNVTARPANSCAAQLGQPGQRVEIQSRNVPGPGTAPSACKADIVAIDNQKKAPEVLNEAEEPEAKPNQAKPAGGTQEGIKVHGHWIIDVRNPDGALATHREFENSLQTTGAIALVNSLAHTSVTGLWAVQMNGALCGGGVYTLYESAEPSIPPC